MTFYSLKLTSIYNHSYMYLIKSLDFCCKYSLVWGLTRLLPNNSRNNSVFSESNNNNMCFGSHQGIEQLIRHFTSYPSPFHLLQVPLIDSTLSNTRHLLYSSVGNPSEVKGLRVEWLLVSLFLEFISRRGEYPEENEIKETKAKGTFS